MFFSRKMGTSFSTIRSDLEPLFLRTAPPMTTRSPGFNVSFNAIEILLTYPSPQSGQPEWRRWLVRKSAGCGSRGEKRRGHSETGEQGPGRNHSTRPMDGAFRFG